MLGLKPKAVRIRLHLLPLREAVGRQQGLGKPTAKEVSALLLGAPGSELWRQNVT